MKKKLIWIIGLVAVAAVIGGALGVRYWFLSPGIRVLGDDIHVELQRTGYIINGSTGEVTGQTPVTINGSTGDTDSETFEGELLVLGYQNDESGTITGTAVVERTDSGFYQIRYLETCTHQEEVDGVTQSVEHICDYSYLYSLYPENPDFLIVTVEDLDGSSGTYVVCADSEEQALKDYQWYLENKP